MTVIEFAEYQVENTSLIFFRLLSFLFFAPGSSFIPVRIKTMFSLVCALFASSIVEIKIIDFFLQAILEVAIGIFMGLILAVLFGAINISGSIMVFQSGLMYAALSDNDSELGGSLTKFFTLLIIVLLVISDFHILILSLVIDSYNYVRFDELLTSGNLTSALAAVASDSFLFALKLSAPILVIGSILYFCSGLINKLIPSIQAFFIVAPLQIWLSLLILTYTLSDFAMYAVNFIIDYLGNLYR